MTLYILGKTTDKATLTIEPDGSLTAWHGLLFSLGLSPCLMPSHSHCATCPASAYVTIATEYRDADCLRVALEEMGYPVEVHGGEGAPLVDYHGQIRPQLAHVIVRRAHVGCSANDLGWERQTDGSFQSHVSKNELISSFNADKQRELGQRYAKAKVIKTAKAKGYTVAETKSADGKITMKLRRY